MMRWGRLYLVLAIASAAVVAATLTTVETVVAQPSDATVAPLSVDSIARALPIARDDAARIATDPSSYITRPQGPDRPANPGETRDVALILRNDASETWDASGPNAVKLSYHLYDAVGRLIAWDGLRTALPHDVAPGESATALLKVALPLWTGTYAVKADLIRDGKAWFAAGGKAPITFPMKVSGDLDAEYGGSTSPATIVPGGNVNITVRVKNDGLATWRAAGANPVRLGYHWFDMASNAVVWDGARTALPRDVTPGEEVSLVVDMHAPRAEGAYALAWDMVQEGKAWFSRAAVPMKEDLVVVQQGVTFYGKGWGHGIGLSQWGAQGWAEGATGTRLNGEQIVQHYFPGAMLATQPESLPFRVLLSAPSTGCVGQTIYSNARMWSAGGFRLVNDADPSVVYLDAEPNHPVRFSVYNGSVLVADDGWSGRRLFAGEDTNITVVPKQWWDPIFIDQKGLAYRGNIKVSVRDEGMLRVVNYVSSDDYMRGVLPSEMPSDWQFEALRAQAITARTYAAWRQSTAGDRTWDVRDDTADQCYAGRSIETPRGAAAVESTAAKILVSDGKPIRALFSSAHGGITENVGCLLDAERDGAGGWKCAAGWPYLQVVDDPAEAAAYDARGGMPHQLWARSFSGATIREQIIEDYGVDIGTFVSMEFKLSPGGRPVSVLIRGTYNFVDLKGDRFLRTTLGLKSTLVRMTAF